MNINENVLVAREGSMQHLSSEFTCGGILYRHWE